MASTQSFVLALAFVSLLVCIVTAAPTGENQNINAQKSDLDPCDKPDGVTDASPDQNTYDRNFHFFTQNGACKYICSTGIIWYVGYSIVIFFVFINVFVLLIAGERHHPPVPIYLVV